MEVLSHYTFGSIDLHFEGPLYCYTSDLEVYKKAHHDKSELPIDKRAGHAPLFLCCLLDDNFSMIYSNLSPTFDPLNACRSYSEL